jgi:GNAT superfamily N-acetyltransferase
MSGAHDQTSFHWKIRRATPNDVDFMRLMLYEAAYWRPGQRRLPFHSALADPKIARYIKGWGRAGDLGLLAVDARNQQLGAAWYRVFAADEPGYGFVDASIPEVTIAIGSPYRRRGVGGELLSALMEQARRAGFKQLSLSVARDNPARALYERHGFVTVKEDGNALTMRADLKERA